MTNLEYLRTINHNRISSKCFNGIMNCYFDEYELFSVNYDKMLSMVGNTSNSIWKQVEFLGDILRPLSKNWNVDNYNEQQKLCIFALTFVVILNQIPRTYR